MDNMKIVKQTIVERIVSENKNDGAIEDGTYKHRRILPLN